MLFQVPNKHHAPHHPHADISPTTISHMFDTDKKINFTLILLGNIGKNKFFGWSISHSWQSSFMYTFG